MYLPPTVLLPPNPPEQTADEEHEPTDDQQAPTQHHHHHHFPGRAWLRRYALPLASGIAGLGIALVFLEHRSGRRKRQLPSQKQAAGLKGGQGSYKDKDGEVRIPLQDVVRFKERQWFIEEIENTRQGDGNAMLRLAKMQLHGQGCERNLPMAQEWLRKARYLGLHATLEELWAGEPEELEQMRAAVAARAARRAASKQGAHGHSNRPPHASSFKAS